MLLVCLDCTCRYAVGLAACPQCGSKKSCELGSAKHAAWLAKASAAPVPPPQETPE